MKDDDAENAQALPHCSRSNVDDPIESKSKNGVILIFGSVLINDFKG
jgi:hypothetical protein